MEPVKQGRVLSRHNKQANLDFKIQNQNNKEALKHTERKTTRPEQDKMRKEQANFKKNQKNLEIKM